MMNPDVKKQWVAALRGGEFTQGQNSLSTPTGYCCLGVLCELAAAAGETLKRETAKGATYYSDFLNTLPPDVRTWAGINVPDPRVTTSAGQILSLSALNDSGHSFAVIADFIEQQL